MAKKDNDFPDVSHETVGLRWAELLKRQYPTHSTKNISRQFGCEMSTAKAWLAGQTPQLRHFIRAAEVFGIAAVLGVLFPDTEVHERLKLHNDLLELRSRLDRLSTDLGKFDHDGKGGKNNREDVS